MQINLFSFYGDVSYMRECIECKLKKQQQPKHNKALFESTEHSHNEEGHLHGSFAPFA